MARHSSPSTSGRMCTATCTFDQMLLWVSITPLGSPVVPDV